MKWGRHLLLNANDAGNVVDTAAALQVSEFVVFQLAYRHWFGRPPQDDAGIEADFKHYLQQAKTPMWVRDFTRRIDRLQRAGELNPVDFGIQPSPASRLSSIMIGCFSLVIMIAFVALLVYSANKTSAGLSLICSFPPCY